MFDNLAAGIYTVTVMDAAGLTNSADLVISDIPGPKINPVITQASCSNTNGSINIISEGGQSPFLYSIDNGVSLQNNGVFNNLDSGRYFAYVSDANGCSVNDTLYLSALPSPAVKLGNDTTLCEGDSLILYAPQAVGYSYVWQDNSNVYMEIVTQPGNYRVTVSNQYGCTATSNVNIQFQSKPAFNLGNDTSLCAGESLKLQVAQLPQDSFLWNTGSTTSSIYVSASGLYWLQEAVMGCIQRDSINVHFKSLPIIALGADTTLCNGQLLVLDVTNDNATYLWQDGSTKSTFTITDAGTYSVKVNENGCDTSGQISVNYITKPVVQLGKDTTLCITEQLLLDATYPQSTYEWQDGSTKPTYAITQAGHYAVDVINTCGDTKDSINVAYENCACKFYVPSAFTPNNDGKNDIFLPKYQCVFSNYELKIFNRWGQLVFVSTSPSAGWDGTLNTKQQPGGTYVWEMSYKDNLTGKVTHRNGTITLIH